jgi:hypothetical protein
MSNTMFIGTRERMLEVKCPNVGMPSGKNGWTSVTDFLNGGASVRRSTAASKRYEMTWTSITRDEARVLLDLADRLYGTGEIYWLDPFVADKNVLPQQWASPLQALYDGLPLIGYDRPTPVLTTGSVGRLPVQSVQYTITSTDNPRSVWIPIPKGHTAHIGVYGAAGTGGKIYATPTYNVANDDTPQELTLLSTNDDSRFNLMVQASGGYDGFKLSLGGVGTITLTGMMVQVLKDGEIPETGEFISGQGNSGCQFASQPEYTPYSAAFDNVGMIASFIETGSWEQ